MGAMVRRAVASGLSGDASEIGKYGGRCDGCQGAPAFSCCRAVGDNEGMAQWIVRDLEIMHGTPVFEGTRVPVQTLFDYLEGGETLEDFLEGFPTVSRESALGVVEEAKRLLLAAS